MTSATFETLLFNTNDDGIATITINRPDKLNALNSKVLSELSEAIKTAESDRDVKAVILTGSGEKAFVAGADIKELSSLNREQGEKLAARGQTIFSAIENCGKPVIAVVNGYALGGGAELAMACHVRIATSNALFGLPEVSLGLIPGYGGTQRLPQLVGKSKAMEMILTGGQLKADEALKFGLVNLVAESDEAMNEAYKLAGKMVKNGPVAISKAIAAVNASSKTDGYAREAMLFGELCTTEDFKEGTTAFLEKRKPSFKGE